MFLQDGLEIFCGGRTVGIRLHELLHSLLEGLISFLAVPHHHSHHVQYVCALGVNQSASSRKSRLGVAESITHGHRSDIDSTKAFWIAFGDKFALVIPKRNELFWILFDHLQVERSGHLGKTFAHPLVPIGIETYCVTPPLVRNLVGSDNFPVPPIAKVHA